MVRLAMSLGTLVTQSLTTQPRVHALLQARLASPHYSAVKLIVRDDDDQLVDFVIPIALFKLFSTLCHRLEEPPLAMTNGRGHGEADKAASPASAASSEDDSDDEVLQLSSTTAALTLHKSPLKPSTTTEYGVKPLLTVRPHYARHNLGY